MKTLIDEIEQILVSPVSDTDNLLTQQHELLERALTALKANEDFRARAVEAIVKERIAEMSSPQPDESYLDGIHDAIKALEEL